MNNMDTMEKQMREFNKRIKEGYVVDWGETRQEGKTTIIALKRSN